jgi:hypothetical protein
MRASVVVAVLLLGLSSVLPGPEMKLGPAVPPVQTAASKAGSTPIPTAALAASVPPQSLNDVCGTLLTSAQNNGLPVAFFADLIWQESRLRDTALSPKGAMGIAQFMPEVAAKSGVANPFDPSQALPASAKLLRDLFDQFGNLGYVAAAYNAGPSRVLDWVERGRALPRETRDYVLDITGRSVEAWRKKPQDDASLRLAPQLPCRGLPAFAALEQAQAPATLSQQKTPAQPEQGARVAKADHPRQPIGRETVRTAERERPRSRHQVHERIA